MAVDGECLGGASSGPGMPRRSWVGRTLGPMPRGSLRGSIFTLMSAAIGPGALLLPSVFRLVGIPVGLLLFFLGAFCSMQSLRLMITIAHVTGRDSFPAGVSAVLGKWAGEAVGHITNLLLVLGTSSNLKFLTGMLARTMPTSIRGLLPPHLVAMAVVFPLCAGKDLSSLRHIVCVAPLSLVYLIVLIFCRSLTAEDSASAWGDSSAIGILSSRDGGCWEVPQAWSIVLNAFTCHHMAVPVYKELHRASSKRVNKVAVRSTTVLMVLYGVIGLSGFLAHGRNTTENILMAYPEEDRGVFIGQMLVSCTLLVAIPLSLHLIRGQILEYLPTRVATAVRDRDSSRAVFAAVTLWLIYSVSSLFPSVSAIAGIACGFFMVLYMFVVPAMVVCTLRWSAKAPVTAAKFHRATLRGSGARSPGGWSNAASSVAGDRDMDVVALQTKWSLEFSLTMLALAAGSLLGFASGTLTVLQVLSPPSQGA